jgi:hypothetical protein
LETSTLELLLELQLEEVEVVVEVVVVVVVVVEGWGEPSSEAWKPGTSSQQSSMKSLWKSRRITFTSLRASAAEYEDIGLSE